MRLCGKIGEVICKIIKVKVMIQKQIERYKRHLSLSEIGAEGQEKINHARVLVVGAGGLGAPALQYLTAAGVGTIGIADNDAVELSNLQRQILYREKQIGQLKVDMAKHTLQELNSYVNFITYPLKIDYNNATEIIANYDIIVGATDNFESRMCLSRETKRQNKPFVNASISEFEGQLGVFNYKGALAYHDLFPSAPKEDSLPMGVMGTLPGVIGSLQANEVIKIIINHDNVLYNKLLIFNILNLSAKIFEL